MDEWTIAKFYLIGLPVVLVLITLYLAKKIK